MRTESVYVITCEICQAVNESHEPSTKCSKCGIPLIVENWGNPPDQEKNQ